MLTIVSWNINSVRRRLDQLARLAEETGPDLICLQETKAEAADFPAAAVAAMGYPHQAVAGSGGYNGVALLSRRPLRDVRTHGHCGRDDARHISARVGDGAGGTAEVHSLYVPAGGDTPDAETNPKFAHKLRFIDSVADFFAGAYGFRDAVVAAGDFNVAPLPTDVWDHAKLSRIVTHTPVEIAALERMKRSLSFVDVVREVIDAEDHVFTWWSYRAADWQAANKGRRLDHVWVTAPLKGRIARAEVLTDVRNWLPPSDHAPVLLALGAERPLESAR